MKAAAIDVGTNSVQTCVGEQTDGGVGSVFENTTNTRLGEGIGTSRRLIPAAMGRTLAAIKADMEMIHSIGVDYVRIVGTSAVRDAENSSEFIQLVREAVGIDIEPLSGQDEARLSYNAIAKDTVLSSFPGSQVVVDVGGGSTELIQGTGDNMGFIVSVKAGAVRFTEKYLTGDPPMHSQLIDAEVMSERLLAKVARKFQVQRCIGVGGSAVNLARVLRSFPPERTAQIHGLPFHVEELRSFIERFLAMPSEERRKTIGLEPERADVILAGAVILERAVTLFGVDELVVSARGLRHGIVYELLRS